MHKEFADLLRCPACRSHVTLSPPTHARGSIDEGDLVCSSCTARYPIQSGVPLMLDPDTRRLVEERTATAEETIAAYRTESTPAVARLLTRLGRHARRVLDIGSGRAPYRDLFEGELICLDLYPQFLYDVQKHSSSRLRIHAVCASATQLPFDYGIADGVFASEVIEHLSPAEARRSLHEWRRYARSWCVIDTPNGHEADMITRVRHLAYRTKTLHDVAHPDVPEFDHHSTFGVGDFESAGYRVHGAIGWVSRKRFRLGPLWDVYDGLAWRWPKIAGTLVAVAPGAAPEQRTERARYGE